MEDEGREREVISYQDQGEIAGPRPRALAATGRVPVSNAGLITTEPPGGDGHGCSWPLGAVFYLDFDGDCDLIGIDWK